MQANGFKGLRNGGGKSKKRNSSAESSASFVTNLAAAHTITNNGKTTNLLPTSKEKLASSVSFGQIQANSSYASRAERERQKDKETEIRKTYILLKYARFLDYVIITWTQEN